MTTEQRRRKKRKKKKKEERKKKADGAALSPNVRCIYVHDEVTLLEYVEGQAFEKEWVHQLQLDRWLDVVGTEAASRQIGLALGR